jgi:hypothetical protein
VSFVARTDRSFVCLACRHRFWPARRCPACQETKWLVDLEVDPQGVSRAPTPTRAASQALGGIGVLGLLGAGGAATAGSIGLAEVLLIPTVVALGASILARPGPAPVARWSILSGPVARAHAVRVTLTGVVRAAKGVKLLRSPIENVVCVAYRLAGESHEMPIDDARARPFDLELEGGERVRVEAGVATLDLPIDETAPRVQPRKDRAAFLGRRGVLAIETVRVSEATLTIGERVIVTGSVHEDAIAAGYRDTRTSRTLFDAPGAPLLIRPAAGTRSANQERPDASA